MKSINDIISESKAGEVKKLYMWAILILFGMWKEYKAYDDLFSSFTEEELEDCQDLCDFLDKCDDDNKRIRFSALKEYFDIMNKMADYVLKSDSKEFGIHDKKEWKEIKTYIS